MTAELQAALAVASCDSIGEGPLWDAARQRLLWLDIAVGTLHEARADGQGGWRETRKWELNRPIGAISLCATGGVIAVAGNEIIRISEAGLVTPFARLLPDTGEVHFNDAKCDPRGRLWAGTMANDFRPGGGALYRIDPDRSVTCVLPHVSVANGIDFSLDGGTLYFVDSATRRVDAFDLDPDRGTIANRRPLVTIPFGEGSPDGLCLDSEGCLWVAIMAQGEIKRFAPDGREELRVRVPALASTSCAFGGAQGDELFITSARIRLPDLFTNYGVTAESIATSHCSPGAGGLFVCRTPVTGAAVHPFAG